MKIILAVLIFLTSFTLLAQFEHQNLVDNKKYNKALKKTQKEYSKNHKSVNALYSFSVLYNIEDSKFFNTDTAYVYALKSKDCYVQASQKELEKLAKQSLDEIAISHQLNAVCVTAFKFAKQFNTVESFNHFLKTFSHNSSLIIEATSHRNKKAFEEAESVNTIKSFQNFIDTYPNAVEIYRAKNARNGIAFTDAKSVNTIASYQTFINKYPHANELKQAKLLRDSIAFEDAKNLNTSASMIHFLKTYPETEFLDKAQYEHDRLHFKEHFVANGPSSTLNYLKTHSQSVYKKVIVDSVYSNAIKYKNYDSFRFLAENTYDLNLHDSIWMHYFKAYTKSGASVMIEEFKEEYSYDFPYESFLKTSYFDALTAELINDDDITIRNPDVLNYLQTHPETYKSFQFSQHILKPYIKDQNWEKATTTIGLLQKEMKRKNSYLNELQDLLIKGDKNINKKRISSVVNTVNGGEYVPVISADNKLLYFCGKNRTDNLYGEDIFVSSNTNGNWGKPKPVNDLNTFENDAPLSVSTDGNTILLFKNGDLFYAEREYGGWSELITFPYPINSDEWDADAMITSDGKSILFSSARDNDHPEIEGIDIYVSNKLEYGWSSPINLGAFINTEFIDRSPYLHSDMKTLYFSSGGHGGFGDVDVYMSTRLNDSTWTDWSEPINLGREINTVGTDWGYKISTDGKTAYFAATDKNDNNDIHTVDLPNYLRPGFVATISGKLIDKNNEPIKATIKWEDLETGKTIGESKSSPEDGSYFIVLPMGKIYGYYIDNGDYYPISSYLDLREEEQAVIREKNIEIVTFNQMINEGISVPINNLFFNTGKWDLLSASKPELKRIAEIIRAHNLKVEISGHTDDVGTDETNQALSENRAEAVKMYLLLLGVNESLITTIGYGESKPNESNENEEGRALNRRVELKFIEK